MRLWGRHKEGKATSCNVVIEDGAYIGCLMRNSRSNGLFRMVPPQNQGDNFGLYCELGDNDMQDGDQLVIIEDDKPKNVGN